MKALRLAVTLLTVIPVPGREPRRPPSRHTAGWAMTLAPLVGLPLGVLAALLVFGMRHLEGVYDPPYVPTLLPPLVGLATLALLTGGLHLDGLADLADGLGSRKPRRQALEVMSSPGIGAFAAAVLVFVLLAQASALRLAIGRHHGTVSLVVAVVAGRTAAMLACVRGVPAARETGLGTLVAGTVPRLRAAIVVLIVLGIAATAGRIDFDGGRPQESAHAVSAVVIGLLVSWLLRKLAERKLGGITGDVLGASVEVTTMVVLIVMAAKVPRYFL